MVTLTVLLGLGSPGYWGGGRRKKGGHRGRTGKRESGQRVSSGRGRSEAVRVKGDAHANDDGESRLRHGEKKVVLGALHEWGKVRQLATKT